MAHISKDRIRETSTTTGTGAFTLDGSMQSFAAFSTVCAVNDTFYYTIAHTSANEWEVGLGTYSATNTLTRTTVLSSSNSGSAVTFTAGTKDVFLTAPASKFLQSDNLGSISLSTDVSLSTITYTTSSITQVAIDSWAGATYRSAKYLIQVTSGTSYQISEALVIHNGTTAYLSEYGVIYTNTDLYSLDATYATGTISLMFTGANAVNNIKVFRVLNKI